eukprot:1124627-Pelagomonas_calceolata.AAC.5
MSARVQSSINERRKESDSIAAYTFRTRKRAQRYHDNRAPDAQVQIKQKPGRLNAPSCLGVSLFPSTARMEINSIPLVTPFIQREATHAAPLQASFAILFRGFALLQAYRTKHPGAALQSHTGEAYMKS